MSSLITFAPAYARTPKARKMEEAILRAANRIVWSALVGGGLLYVFGLGLLVMRLVFPGLASSLSATGLVATGIVIAVAIPVAVLVTAPSLLALARRLAGD